MAETKQNKKQSKLLARVAGVVLGIAGMAGGAYAVLNSVSGNFRADILSGLRALDGGPQSAGDGRASVISNRG